MANTSVFLTIPEDRWIYESPNFFVIKDNYPVSPGHCLIISKEVKADFFELSETEMVDLVITIQDVKDLIETEYNPDGYNVGFNCGVSAGQTVMHFHCHVIPRYTGDMVDPRGGVRHCVEGKGYY
jgi:diadenosine tetraphosphate (Ap4A) HIT family hydrolase